MDIKERLLKYYNLSLNDLKARQIDRPLSFIKDPFKYMDKFSITIDYLKECILNKTKIVIYGDYDVDGMTSTAILVKAFKKLNYEVGYFIPSRYKQGYGLNEDMIDLFNQKGYKVIICVDNGISKIEEVEYAKKLGIEVVIIDHHEVVDNFLPNSKYIIHQKLCNYTKYNISAAFLAMLIYYGLVGEYDDYIVTLAGIAVISDMMELVDLNLLILKYAIKNINKCIYPQFNLLLFDKYDNIKIIQDKAYYNYDLLNYPVTSNDISFKIVPLLNSLGRVDISIKNNNGVRFLVSDKKDEIIKYYNFIIKVNKQKIDILKEVKSKLEYDNSSSKISIKIIENLPIGLIGGIVNDYILKTNKNAILFAYKDDTKQELVGSGRGINGFNIYSCLNEFRYEFINFGGHPFAFGLTIKSADFNKIKDEIIKKVDTLKPVIENKKYIKLDLEDINISTFDVINEFEPFGMGFKSPIFYIEIDKNLFKLSSSKKHLLFKSSKGVSVNYFNFPSNIEKLDKLQLSLTYQKSVFLNRLQYSFTVSELLNEKEDYDLIY